MIFSDFSDDLSDFFSFLIFTSNIYIIQKIGFLTVEKTSSGKWKKEKTVSDLQGQFLRKE